MFFRFLFIRVMLFYCLAFIHLKFHVVFSVWRLFVGWWIVVLLFSVFSRLHSNSASHHFSLTRRLTGAHWMLPFSRLSFFFVLFVWRGNALLWHQSHFLLISFLTTCSNNYNMMWHRIKNSWFYYAMRTRKKTKVFHYSKPYDFVSCDEFQIRHDNSAQLYVCVCVSFFWCNTFSFKPWTRCESINSRMRNIFSPTHRDDCRVERKRIDSSFVWHFRFRRMINEQ